ncbi:hypothetical protein SAMN02745249_00985 [Atopostipes suicloacalis DSM 15692]|uniref:Uncharacterized protein n=1 Tax=Atopostipes suicloacalis DSM 15692 TaxID=1121025 RepID=A0A1M4VPU1_9LACT|nr:hypothetical protein [Atopostipes suicloacalis]SHE70979.1 hypothetical protein SAMN02745249_00985 [Atopostipes suicloacalis DSM 15692]
MRYLTSNLFFSSFLIVGVGALIWYLLNESSKKERQSILSVFTDFIFNFVLTLFALNVVLHFKAIIEFPYRVLMFSSSVVFIASLLLTIYSTLKYGEKMWMKPTKSKSIAQLFLFIGLTNHLYLYVLYGNLQTILFIAYFILLLFLISFTPVFKRVDPLLFILFSMGIHLLLMKNQPIVYLNFTFYTIPLLILTLTLVLILYYQRRKLQSKQK